MTITRRERRCGVDLRKWRDLPREASSRLGGGPVRLIAVCFQSRSTRSKGFIRVRRRIRCRSGPVEAKPAGPRRARAGVANFECCPCHWYCQWAVVLLLAWPGPGPGPGAGKPSNLSTGKGRCPPRSAEGTPSRNLNLNSHRGKRPWPTSAVAALRGAGVEGATQARAQAVAT